MRIVFVGTAAADGDVVGGDVELTLEFVAAGFELDDVAGDGVDDASLEFELDVLAGGDGVGLGVERGVAIAASAAVVAATGSAAC